MDTDDGKEKDEKKSDDDNVADRLDGDNQTLDDFLQAFRPVDGPERSEHTEDTKNLEESNATAAEDWDKGDADNNNVKTVERRSGKCSFVEQEPVGDQLEGALDGEDRGEEVVPVSQSLRRKHQFNVCLSFNTHNIDVRLTPERVFTGKQGGGDKNTDKDEVGHDGVTL